MEAAWQRRADPDQPPPRLTDDGLLLPPDITYFIVWKFEEWWRWWHHGQNEYEMHGSHQVYFGDYMYYGRPTVSARFYFAWVVLEQADNYWWFE